MEVGSVERDEEGLRATRGERHVREEQEEAAADLVTRLEGVGGERHTREGVPVDGEDPGLRRHDLGQKVDSDAVGRASGGGGVHEVRDHQLADHLRERAGGRPLGAVRCPARGELVLVRHHRAAVGADRQPGDAVFDDDLHGLAGPCRHRDHARILPGRVGVRRQEGEDADLAGGEDAIHAVLLEIRLHIDHAAVVVRYHEVEVRDMGVAILREALAAIEGRVEAIGRGAEHDRVVVVDRTDVFVDLDAVRAAIEKRGEQVDDTTALGRVRHAERPAHGWLVPGAHEQVVAERRVGVDGDGHGAVVGLEHGRRSIGRHRGPTLASGQEGKDG